MPKISIIVPVYNREEYLDQALQSLAGQVFSDFECILVDDGSTDGSPAICDRWATQDTRFKVFHQQNAGVSAARNIGIAQSTGEWLAFLDADDTLEPDHLSLLIDHAGLHTLPVCAMLLDYFENDQMVPLTYVHGEGPLPPESLSSLSDANLLNSPCNKLFWSDTVRKHALCFNSALRLGEDLDFVLAYLGTTRFDFYVQNKPTYRYRKFNGGHAYVSNDVFFISQQTIYTALAQRCAQYNCPQKELDQLFENYLAALSIGLEQRFKSRLDAGRGPAYRALLDAMRDPVVVDALDQNRRRAARFPGSFAIRHGLPRLYRTWVLLDGLAHGAWHRAKGLFAKVTH